MEQESEKKMEVIRDLTKKREDVMQKTRAIVMERAQLIMI